MKRNMVRKKGNGKREKERSRERYSIVTEGEKEANEENEQDKGGL